MKWMQKVYIAEADNLFMNQHFQDLADLYQQYQQKPTVTTRPAVGTHDSNPYGVSTFPIPNVDLMTQGMVAIVNYNNEFIGWCLKTDYYNMSWVIRLSESKALVGFIGTSSRHEKMRFFKWYIGDRATILDQEFTHGQIDPWLSMYDKFTKLIASAKTNLTSIRKPKLKSESKRRIGRRAF